MAFCKKRIYNLMMMLLLLGVLLGGRLAVLQLMEGPKLTAQSVVSRAQEVPIDVSRGEIVDRNGIPLTNTAHYFSVIVFPGQLADIQQAAVQIAAFTGTAAEELAIRMERDQRPFKLRSQLDAATAQQINALNLPGILVMDEQARYNQHSLAIHIAGYINAADNRGVSGIEELFDDVLRGGRREYAAAMVDATRQVIPGLGYKRIKIGEGGGASNVILTVDIRIQQIVETVLDRHHAKGAVVILQPSTGAVLALASRPNFDANNLERYLNSPASPLLNRAISAYQPGSVFKLVVAAAALESRLVGMEDVFFDSGFIDIGGIRFRGWDFEHGPRGQITFRQAMAYSSNPVFIEVGQKLGGERLSAYARKLGFGEKTALNFPGEAPGNLPTDNRMYPGELANFSIGQGEFEATPLQMACLVATIVNDGIKVDPYLVSKLTDYNGMVIKTYPASRGNRVLSKQTAVWMREMMTEVTTYGTGQGAYVKAGGSAGKTGSAETGRKNADGKGINHAWFAGYAPLAQPQYAAVVFIEEGMSGGDVAAPIFAEIMAEIIALNQGENQTEG